MFFKHSLEGEITIIIVYVDDIILTGDYVEDMCILKEILAKEFEIKDLGDLNFFFLGWKLHGQREESLSHSVSTF